MKTPRILDFDPDAKTSTLKSSLDNMPAIQKRDLKTPTQSPIQPVKTPVINHQPSIHPVKEIISKQVEKLVKRAIRTRHPFDIYEDQYVDLRQLSLGLQMKGVQSSMSQMVREALDSYLTAKKKEIK